ncbi:unnamed protein product [Diplocarpon coronariae]
MTVDHMTSMPTMFSIPAKWATGDSSVFTSPITRAPSWPHEVSASAHLIWPGTSPSRRHSRTHLVAALRLRPDIGSPSYGLKDDLLLMPCRRSM